MISENLMMSIAADRLRTARQL